MLDPRGRRAEQPAGRLAERDDARAGQRRDVDQMRRAELPRVPEAVAEDQAAFGVGVDDLDGLARRRSSGCRPA